MKLSVRETVVLAFLGAIMFCSKLLTESIPNVHLLALLIIAYTVIFRAKALYAIFVFIMLTGLFYGFGVWWVPYFYLWPILWAVTMLLPKNMPTKVAVPVYMAVGGLHGMLYGTMYAPFQALAYGLSFKAMLSWIAAGLPWDLVHGVGNICVCSLTVPLIKIIRKAMAVSKMSR